MGQIRIEFAAVGGGRGTLGAQIDAEGEKPVASVTLTATSTATAAGAQPIIPAAIGANVFATLIALDAAIYVDIGSVPDPTAEPRRLVVPGRPVRVQAVAGDRVSVLLASDVTLPAGGGGGGGAVTIADGAAVALGARADAAATDATSAWSAVAVLKGLYARLSGTLSISASALPLPAGAASAANQATANAALGAPADVAYAGTGTPSILAALKGLYAALVAPTPAGEAHLGEIGGNSAVVVASFARPANTTAYASGQLVANATAAGSVAPLQFAVGRINGGKGRLSRLRLLKSGTAIANASFRVHIYRASPTPSNGDGGAWLTTESTYLGAFDVTIDKVFADGSKGIGVPNTGSYITFDCAPGSNLLYGLVEARAAYAPVSAETFTAALEADRD